MVGGNEPIGGTRLGGTFRRTTFSSRRRDCVLRMPRRKCFCAESYGARTAVACSGFNEFADRLPHSVHDSNRQPTVKVVPAFSLLETSIVPPCASTMALEMARPRPALPGGGSRFVAAIKPLEHMRQILAGNSRPRVADRQHGQAGLRFPVSRALRRRSGCIEWRWSAGW